MSAFKAPPELSLRTSSAEARQFECVVAADGQNAAWIGARGELDLASAPQLERTLHEALDSARMIVLDLRQLTFIDSTGLHLIIEAHGRARDAKRRLVLIRGPAQIHNLFELVGLADRLEIVDLEQDDPRDASPADPTPMR